LNEFEPTFIRKWIRRYGKQHNESVANKKQYNKFVTFAIPVLYG